MKSLDQQLKQWSNVFANPAKLNQNESAVTSLAAAVFLVMAILQAISFTDFKEALQGLGLTDGPATWALVLIIAEVWAALALMRIDLPGLVRFFGGFFAVFATGFWFIQSVQVVATAAAGEVVNSGFFGKYLMQQPGWWTVVEASILLFWTVYVLKLIQKR